MKGRIQKSAELLSIAKMYIDAEKYERVYVEERKTGSHGGIHKSGVLSS